MSHPEYRVPRSRAFQITHHALREEILQALEPLLFGSMHGAYAARAALEQAFAGAVQQPHAVAIHSATMGLFLALRACGIAPGDEVITVGNSDISTTAAIHHCGAVPVLCDVLPQDYTLDVSLVERLITPRTRALLPVDLHGHPADVQALRPLAEHYRLKIVEDAALATGASDHGRPVGAFADVSVFSFAPFKPMGSAGNGAMVVTGAADIAGRLRLLTGYGHAPDRDLTDVPTGHQHYIAEGYNVPLDGLEAALVLVKIPYLAQWTARRQAIARLYEQGLAGTAARCPSFRPQSAPTFRSYTICVPAAQRPALYESLRQAGIEVILHYTPPVYRYPVYAGGLPGSQALPVTDRLATELISLPVAPELTDADIHEVLSALRAHLA
ncbi:MAG: DegT/DnrJ/EryC1/StrS family aminotransferase [Anaerolineae bacterium]|jgi:dTDP-4-amino-4,6-dideoxygalactose transaminase|nr:DegT/DnrJ/EryC1/StrS family aminotransferase [Anaerolineae bacterium]